MTLMQTETFSKRDPRHPVYDCGVDGLGPCEDEKCQECCPHDQVEYNQCADCEKEFDPGAAIDRAMDALEDR